jgi:hypothetical protein
MLCYGVSRSTREITRRLEGGEDVSPGYIAAAVEGRESRLQHRLPTFAFQDAFKRVVHAR